MSKPKPSVSTSSFKMVNVNELNIDPETQRKLSVPWVKARVQKFDVDQLGHITVSLRDGKLYVVDGQHRVELMRTVGWGDQKIHAKVFEGLSQAQEATLFNALNDRKSVRLYDKFRVSIVAGDAAAGDINRIVKEHGMVISDQLVDGHICAIESLQRVYAGAGIASPKAGPKALSNALEVLLKSWGNQASSINGKVVHGIGMVFLRHNGTVNVGELAKKLAPLPGGAPGLLGKGRSLRELSAKPLHHCIASVVVDIYNKGRRGTKLERWES